MRGLQNISRIVLLAAPADCESSGLLQMELLYDVNEHGRAFSIDTTRSSIDSRIYSLKVQ